MSYTIDLGQWNSIFAVPASVVDNHIKLATEAQLKVLLYILRNSGTELDDGRISSALHIDPAEVKNAVEFWTERGLIAENSGALSPAPAQAVSQPVNQEPEKPKKQRTAVSRAQRPDPEFVSKLLIEDQIFAGLMQDAQGVFGKPISPGDRDTFAMLYTTFGLPCEVIAMMMTYLSSVGSANMRAVERMGIRWSDDGITTTEDAEREIERMQSSREAWGSVSRLLGIRNVGRPTASQLEHAHRWVNEWGFSDEMISEAYERCVNTKGEYNIRYINAILQKWHDKNIMSLDTLREQEEASKRKPKAKTDPGKKGSVFSTQGASFDISKYENTSLFDD